MGVIPEWFYRDPVLDDENLDSGLKPAGMTNFFSFSLAQLIVRAFDDK